MKEIVATTNAPAAIGPYSQAVQSGQFLFCSGQIALDPQTGHIVEGDVSAQTHRVMRNIDAILDEARYSWDHVVKVSIFLKDMNDFAIVNEIYASYMGAQPPARETVEVARLPKDALVEISVTAHKI